MFPIVTLKEGKDRKVRNFHPWIYRDEIAVVDRNAERMPQSGGFVAIADAGGRSIAKAWYSPKARLALRVLTLEVAEDLDAAFFAKRVGSALALRQRVGLDGGDRAFRLIHAEADLLPGVMADVYAGHVVLQLRYAGADAFRSLIVEAIGKAVSPRGIYERSDMEGRKEEGLEPVRGLLKGTVPAQVEFQEGPARFRALVHEGHKTGFYLDQRENRSLLAARVKPGMRVLDAFASTGAFSVRLALAGASVVSVEKDPAAAEEARAHAAANGVAGKIDIRVADCFEALPKIADAGEKFDLVIVDPPAIAKKKEEQGTARWGFVTLSTAALRMLSPGGALFASSCAYHLSPTLLEETIRIAGGQTGKRLRVITETFQPPDHPWILQIPETLYLKSVLVEAA